MKVGTGGNLGLSREYHKNLFGPLFYTWWNCPLIFMTAASAEQDGKSPTDTQSVGNSAKIEKVKNLSFNENILNY